MSVESERRRAAARKAGRTLRWAKTMTKWLISRNGRKGAKWHVVNFLGPANSESAGVVDLLAVRKNHRMQDDVLKRGDLFDIVLIQVKGGNASFPTQEDIRRLRKAARYHRAKGIVLSEWKPQKRLQLYILARNRWAPIAPSAVFS